jgi:monoamine oxidase
VACLTRAFGPRAGSPVEFLEQDWTAERWSGGCYGAHAPPGVLTQFGPALREPCGRIHWAGSETATVWSGYMDGAVRSGERVAAALTSG